MAPVLNIPFLQIQTGDRVFIEGPSGSGKTTLLSLLAGVLTPQEGTITLLDQQINTMGAAQRDRFRADHIGFIFQLFNLIPYLSILENVTLPCWFSPLRRQKVQHSDHTLATEALRLLTHLDLASASLLNRSVTELSVGQQQRVAAARALIGSPEIVIADEPTSALDTDRREAFIRLIFSECEQAKTTLIFVSHDRSLAPLFHRRIQLQEINQIRS